MNTGGHRDLAMEQLLGGAGGGGARRGPHQFGRDVREALPRGPKGVGRYSARGDKKGSLGARTEGHFVTSAISGPCAGANRPEDDAASRPSADGAGPGSRSSSPEK